MSIFEKRVAFRPYEYPRCEDFKKSIQHAYWIHSEWSFLSDIQDFRVGLNQRERDVIRHTLLAISQIEVSVKRFWGKLGDKLPKAEFEQVGAVFAESEVRHSDSYAHLLHVLNLDGDFALLLENDVIKNRVEYLTSYLKRAADSSDEGFTLVLALFSLFVENVSLFSQFVIIKSFRHYKNMLKDIGNVVDATFREETIHALFGVYIINEIKAESPDWFNDDFYQKIYRACKKAYAAECGIIDWIFRDGDLDFLSTYTLKEFVKQRFNESVKMIGGQEVFAVDADAIVDLMWFQEEIHGSTNIDFFNVKSTNYHKKAQSITPEDLF